jgi:uncharacterized protein
MGRIFFFLLLALAVYVGWRLLRAQKVAGPRTRRGTGGAEAMVRCEVCGLNVPQSEALAAPGSDPQRWYCCDEHRRQGAARG